MSGNVIVECRGITKRYGGHCALDHVDLDVLEGEVFGLVGPNGAGKTTFIKILLGLASPTAGSARMFGEDLFTERGRATAAVGAVVEAPVFFEYMSGWDNLWHLSALSGGVPPGQVRKALDIVGLADVARKRVGTYSYGMKQRLGIAQALLPCSRFLVLDEPTNGLDPHGIAGIRQLIRTLAAEHGITIFMSSHLLVEVEQLCGRVAILGRGKKVLEGTVAELRANTRQAIVLVRPSAGAEARLASHRDLGLKDTTFIGFDYWHHTDSGNLAAPLKIAYHQDRYVYVLDTVKSTIYVYQLFFGDLDAEDD